MRREGTRELLFLGLLSAAVCLLFLVIFWEEDVGKLYEANKNTAAAGKSDSGYSCTRIDLETSDDEAVEIDLSQIDGDYTITEAGRYLLYGDYEGQICVDAEEQIIHFILRDVRIDSKSGSAIDVRTAGKVVITLEENTTNIIQDNAHYRGREDGDAAIYSACDLTVNGAGLLKVYGLYDHGIHSRDMVKILGGDIFVQAKGNGIQGNDGLLLCPSFLSVESEENGLYSKKTGDEKKGAIDISGGEISIISGAYGISSSQNLYVHDCSVWSNAVLGTFSVEGEEYFMEGCLVNEQVSP
mgnify:CR=1 FL=1